MASSKMTLLESPKGDIVSSSNYSGVLPVLHEAINHQNQLKERYIMILLFPYMTAFTSYINHKCSWRYPYGQHEKPRKAVIRLTYNTFMVTVQNEILSQNR
jgi:hypothetical protein